MAIGRCLTNEKVETWLLYSHCRCFFMLMTSEVTGALRNCRALRFLPLRLLLLPVLYRPLCPPGRSYGTQMANGRNAKWRCNDRSIASHDGWVVSEYARRKHGSRLCSWRYRRCSKLLREGCRWLAPDCWVSCTSPVYRLGSTGRIMPLIHTTVAALTNNALPFLYSGFKGNGCGAAKSLSTS